MSTTSTTSTTSLFKSVETLRGTILFTYTASLLHVLGLIGGYQDKECPTFTKGTLVRFYGSDSVIRHHTKQGNMEQVAANMYRLTAQGKTKFIGRVTGKTGQSVDRDLLPQFIESVKTGKFHAKLGKMYPVK